MHYFPGTNLGDLRCLHGLDQVLSHSLVKGWRPCRVHLKKLFMDVVLVQSELTMSCIVRETVKTKSISVGLFSCEFYWKRIVS